MGCMNCGSDHDVVSFQKGEETISLCAGCRFKLLTGPKTKQMGRPVLGVTKKVSVTLPQPVWDYVEREANGNRSEYLRKLIERDMWDEGWSNNACLGYALFGAEELGYSEQQKKELIGAIYRAFDLKTVTEAKRKYDEF